MERVRSSISTIGEQPRPFTTVALEGPDRVFRRLPIFLPWVWKLIAMVGVVGFMFGIVVGYWADWSLSK